ncbi:MAG: tetratricopeptide repeat protein [Candidatus Schekmanbacteria bacterium]|nr:MAG: tetratricopeptide repeat protein [Candidatus Schekmanbacteria bacterium]
MYKQKKLFVCLFLIAFLIFSSCKSAEQRKEEERLAILYHNAGVKFFADGDYERALRNFSNAVKYDEKNPYYLNDLALTYSMLREYDTALRYFRKALSIKPNESEIRNGMASTLAIQGDLADAIVEWKKVINDPLYKSPSIVYYNLGKAYFQLGDIDSAKKSFHNVLKYDPKNVETLYFLGIISEKRGNYEEAARYYERSIAANPDFAPSHYNLGVNYYLRNLYPEAEAEFRWIVYSGKDETLKIKAKEYLDKLNTSLKNK